MADIKGAADYDQMTDIEKEIFDKLLLAQWKVQKEEMDKMDDKVNKGGMTQEEFDAMTDEEKEAHKEKMSGMRDMFHEKMDGRTKDEFDLRDKAGYMKMDDNQKQCFDGKMDEKRGRVNDEMKGMVDKFHTGMKEQGPNMSDDDKKKNIKDGMDMMKMKGSRDMQFEKHDFEQMNKMGYCTQMS
jgi:hypothetical protein